MMAEAEDKELEAHMTMRERFRKGILFASHGAPKVGKSINLTDPTYSKRKIKISLLMVAVSIVIGCLFFIDAFHTIYWSHPIVTFGFSAVGLFCAFYGGHETGKNLLNIKNTRLYNDVSSLMGVLITLAAGVWLWFTFMIGMDVQSDNFVISIPFLVLGIFMFGAGIRWIYLHRPNVKYTSDNSPCLSMLHLWPLFLVAVLLGLFEVALVSVGLFGFFSGQGGNFGDYHGYGSYNGDFMIAGLQVLALQIGILCGITSFYFLGFTSATCPGDGQCRTTADAK